MICGAAVEGQILPGLQVPEGGGLWAYRGWRTLGFAVRRVLALGTRAVFSSLFVLTVPGILIPGTPSAGLELIACRALFFSMYILSFL